MKAFLRFGILPLALLVAATQSARAAEACDRDCLRGTVMQYLDAMVAHNPGMLAVAPDVKFTEDGVQQKLGEGLWKTASKLRSFRQDILDVRQGVAGSDAVVDEGGKPVLLALRLKVVDRKITEVETLVVHNQAEGMIFDTDAIQTPSAGNRLRWRSCLVLPA